MVSAGKALTGRVGLDDGHDVMNGAASENTSFMLRGTSKEPLHGLTPLTAPSIKNGLKIKLINIVDGGRMLTCDPAGVASFGCEN